MGGRNAGPRDAVLLKIEAHFVSRRESSTVTVLTELYRILGSSLISSYLGKAVP